MFPSPILRLLIMLTCLLWQAALPAMPTDKVVVSLRFVGDSVAIANEAPSVVKVTHNDTATAVRVYIKQTDRHPEIRLSGKSTCSRLIVSSAVDYTIVADSLHLQCGNKRVIRSLTDRSVTLHLADGTANVLHGGIKCGGNLLINGHGSLSVSTHKDGEEYVKPSGRKAYHTAKCIYVKGDLTIDSGTIDCLSTGLGGKGIEAVGRLAIGRSGDAPTLRVETTAGPIVNDTTADKRYGCPKGIKARAAIYVYGGRIYVKTHGMGGEGIESRTGMKVKGGYIECHTYDDGINVGKNFSMTGGTVYCHSIDNDGIDSNGSLTIDGGHLTAISSHRFNEGLDAHRRQISVHGGTVIAMGGSPIRLKETTQPYYSTGISRLWPSPTHIHLREGSHYAVTKDGMTLWKLTCPREVQKGSLFVSAPTLEPAVTYTVEEDGQALLTFKPSVSTTESEDDTMR